MTKRFIALIALLGAVTPAQAHQIWIEQAEGQNAVVRFGEYGENLREASPGLLDKFAKVTATLISAKGEQKSDGSRARTSPTGTIPQRATSRVSPRSSPSSRSTSCRPVRKASSG
jgi:hypothetical protein